MADKEKMAMGSSGELTQDDIDALMSQGGDAEDTPTDDAAGADHEQDRLAEEWAKALDEGLDIEEGVPLGQEAKQAQFTDLGGARKTTTSRDLDFILDIPLDVTVEIGRNRMLINDLLQLGQGSIIELNRLAGEPLDILVNNKLIARGEVVVVSEKFAIRITDIVSPMERVKRLG